MLICLLVMVIFLLITLPTRVTANSSTIIDHLITNDHKNIISLGIIKTDLTCYLLKQIKSKHIQM